MDVIALAALIWVFSVALGWAVGHSRQNGIEGFLYPFVFGPVGLVLAIAWVKPPAEEDQAGTTSSSS